MLQARGDCARMWARRQGRPRHPQSPHVCWSVALRTPFSKSEEGDPSPYPAGESQCPTPLVPLTSPSPGDSPRRPPVPRPQTRLPGPPSSQRATRWPWGLSRARASISGSHQQLPAPLRRVERPSTQPAKLARVCALPRTPAGSTSPCSPTGSPAALWAGITCRGPGRERRGLGEGSRSVPLAPPSISPPPAFWEGGA